MFKDYLHSRKIPAFLGKDEVQFKKPRRKVVLKNPKFERNYYLLEVEYYRAGKTDYKNVAKSYVAIPIYHEPKDTYLYVKVKGHDIRLKDLRNLVNSIRSDLEDSFLQTSLEDFGNGKS